MTSVAAWTKAKVKWPNAAAILAAWKLQKAFQVTCTRLKKGGTADLAPPEQQKLIVKLSEFAFCMCGLLRMRHRQDLAKARPWVDVEHPNTRDRLYRNSAIPARRSYDGGTHRSAQLTQGIGQPLLHSARGDAE